MTGKALVSDQTTTAVAKVSAARLPATVSHGILDLLTVFAAAQQ